MLRIPPKLKYPVRAPDQRPWRLQANNRIARQMIPDKVDKFSKWRLWFSLWIVLDAEIGFSASRFKKASQRACRHIRSRKHTSTGPPRPTFFQLHWLSPNPRIRAVTTKLIEQFPKMPFIRGPSVYPIPIDRATIAPHLDAASVFDTIPK